MKKNKQLGFIGCGNMGTALLTALLKARLFRPTQIGVSEPSAERRRIVRRLKAALFETNRALAEACRVILLAVKPQQMRGVLEEISPAIRKDHLILSIAAGLDCRLLGSLLPPGTRVIRIMPNAPSMIGEGASALFAAPTATAADRRLALKIFRTVGQAVTVPEEEWIDTVTALSGSGPAFVYLFIEALLKAGESLGLPIDLARPLVLQTLIGATRLAAQSREPLALLIQKVASKGGTTEAGLELLRSRDFEEIIGDTIRAAARRATELREGR